MERKFNVVMDIELSVIVETLPPVEEIDEAADATIKPSEFLGYKSKSSLIGVFPSTGGCWLHDSFMACKSEVSRY